MGIFQVLVICWSVLFYLILLLGCTQCRTWVFLSAQAKKILKPLFTKSFLLLRRFTCSFFICDFLFFLFIGVELEDDLACFCFGFGFGRFVEFDDEFLSKVSEFSSVEYIVAWLISISAPILTSNFCCRGRRFRYYNVRFRVAASFCFGKPLHQTHDIDASQTVVSRQTHEVVQSENQTTLIRRIQRSHQIS